MSYQAVKWALGESPMLLTDKGKNDASARAVLCSLAEHANEHGASSHPSVLRMQFETGYDERTVQRALDRLEQAKLIEQTGMTFSGTIIWKLDMSRVRPEDEWESMKARAEEKKASEAARVKAYRDRKASPESAPGDESRTDTKSVRTDSLTVRTDFKSVRTDGTPPEPLRNHQENHQGEPPTGERPPRTPPNRDASGATDRQPDSSQSDQDQPLQGDRNQRPRTRDASRTRTKCEHGLTNTQTNPCLFCRRGLPATGDTP